MPAPRSESTETAIRERAYYLWEQSGRPPGRDAEFWASAVAMFKEPATPGAKPKAARAARPAAAKAASIASQRTPATKLPPVAPAARSSKARAVKA